MKYDYHLVVRFAPETGSIKPWELWSSDSDCRLIRHCGSFKTEAAAERKRAKGQIIIDRRNAESLR